MKFILVKLCLNLIWNTHLFTRLRSQVCFENLFGSSCLPRMHSELMQCFKAFFLFKNCFPEYVNLISMVVNNGLFRSEAIMPYSRIMGDIKYGLIHSKNSATIPDLSPTTIILHCKTLCRIPALIIFQALASCSYYLHHKKNNVSSTLSKYMLVFFLSK